MESRKVWISWQIPGTIQEGVECVSLDELGSKIGDLIYGPDGVGEVRVHYVARGD